MTPHGEIVHCITHRIRIRVPEKKTDVAYWQHVIDTLKTLPGVTSLRANPATASILVLHTMSDRTLLAYAREQKLFKTERKQRKAIPLQRQVTKGFGDMNASVKKFSGGELDVGSLTFLGLVGIGAYQIARGNLTAPAWYTAFWYAMNVFLKNQQPDELDDIPLDEGDE